MSVQTSYNLYPSAAIAGSRYRKGGPERIVPRVPRNSAYPGRFAFKVPGYGGAGSNFLDPGEIYQVPSPAPAVDADAILASGGASALTVQTLSGAALNGVVGTTKMFPGRKITVTFSTHADWLAGNATLTGKRNGVTISETLAVPNGGGSAVTSTQEFDQVTSLELPVGGGTSGTFTIGIAVLTAAALSDIEGVVMHVPMHEQDDEGDGLVYADGEPVDLMEMGEVWVEAETTISQSDTIYVRVSAGAGGTLLGKVRNDSDSSSAVAHTGVKFRKYDANTGLVALLLK